MYIMIYIFSCTSPHSNQMSTRENRLLVRKTNNKIGSTGIDAISCIGRKIDTSHEIGI
jgi:hypothetical protein